jgi:hypothetical protein
MATRETRRDVNRRRIEAEQARLAELIANDPFQTVPLARPRPSQSELVAMGLECAAEYRRRFGKDH